jgi:hypothetical protein
VYLLDKTSPGRSSENASDMAPSVSVALDARLQQGKGCLYALGAGAHNPRAASAHSLAAQIEIKKASHSGRISA